MYRLVLTVHDPQKAIRALQRAGIAAQVELARELTESRGIGGDQDKAQAVYDLAAQGLTYAEVAERIGVSYHTVLRVATNPGNYGLKSKPIRRSFRGRRA